MKDGTAAVHAQVPVDVATFLLNEKREDIHKIETRFRLDVVLIPNIYLTTPNYEVERLRHDSEKLDVTTPSYELVNKPVQELKTSVPSAVPDNRPPKPEPIVKGITPSQPAPMGAEPAPRSALMPPVVTPATKPGLWSRFLSIFSSQPESAAPAAPAAKAERGSREDRDGRRGERKRDDRSGRGGRDRGENRGEKSERGERPERGDRKPREDRSRRDQPRADGAPVPPNGQSVVAPQNGQPQQKPRGQTNKPALEAKPAETPERDGEGRSRRRRGRGGRDRTDRPDGQIRSDQTSDVNPAIDQNTVETSPAQLAETNVTREAPIREMEPHAITDTQGMRSSTESPAHAEVIATASNVAAPAETSSDSADQAPVTPQVPQAAVPSELQTVQHSEPDAPIPTPAPAQQSFGAPPAMMPVDEIADAGPIRSAPRQRKQSDGNGIASEPLVAVETRNESVQPVLEIPEPARRSTPRPRRQRTVANEPLVFVETQTQDESPKP